MLHPIDTGFIRADADPGIQDITTIFSRVLAEIVEIITDLLSGEPSGLAVDFTDEDQPLLSPWDQEWVQVKQNASPHTFFTQSGTSPKYVKTSATGIGWSPHNLMRSSQTFDNTDWTASASAVTTTANDTTSPDNTVTADKVTADGTSNQHYIETHITVSPTTVPGMLYSISVYAKPDTATHLHILYTADNIYAQFDLATGALVNDGVAAGTFVSGSSTADANGFRRYTMVLIPSTASQSIRIYSLNAAVDTAGPSQTSTASMWVWGAQTNRGIAPTAYIATTTAAKLGLPISYGEGLLVEPAGTNRLAQSQSFDTTWVPSNASVTANTTVSPDGSTTADTITGDGTGGVSHFIYQGPVTSADGAFSVYAKAGTESYITLTGQGATGSVQHHATQVFDLALAAVGETHFGSVSGSISNATITAVGNGWYRCSMFFNTDETDHYHIIGIATAASGNSFDVAGRAISSTTGTLILWGAQSETGTVATSYVPTVAASATRAADIPSVSVASVTPWSTTAGSVYYDFIDKQAAGTANYLLNISDTGNERFVLLNYTDNSPYFSVIDGGVSQADIDPGTAVRDARSQFSVAWAANDFDASIDGGTTQSDSSGTLPTPIIFRFFTETDGSTTHRGVVRRLVYVPRQVQTSSGDLSTWRYNFAGDDLLDGEPIGFAVDFTDTTYYDEQTWNQYEWVQVKKTYSPHTFFTQSGTSPKYVKNSATTIGWSPHNLILQSQTIGSWSLAGAGRLTVSSDATTAPDGTSTADQLIEGTNAATTHWADTAAITLIAGFAYTWSCYLKPNGRTWVVLNAIDDILDHRVYFELAGAGTVGTTAAGSTATITSIANGWYFVTNTLVSNGSGPEANLEIMLAEADNDVTYTGDGTSGVYAWGAQVNRGYFPTAYIVTTTAAKIGLPISYGEGLLVEPAGTNLITQSQTFDNVLWLTNNATVTANDTTAPDGSATADKIDQTGAGAFIWGINGSVTISASTNYTLSVYAKSDGAAQWLNMDALDNAGVNGYAAWFDILNGVAGTTSVIGSGFTFVSHAITSIGSGWYRIAITFSTTGTTVKLFSSLRTADGGPTSDTTNNYYLWGAQVETGTVATSYIPTVAASATRAKDTVTAALSTFPFSTTLGTVYVDFTQNPVDVNYPAKWSMSDADIDQIRMYNVGTTLKFQNFSDLDIAVGTLTTARAQVTTAWKANDCASSFNGAAIVADTSATIGDMTSGSLWIGTDVTGAAGTMTGLVKRFVYAPRRVIDGDLPTWRYTA